MKTNSLFLGAILLIIIASCGPSQKKTEETKDTATTVAVTPTQDSLSAEEVITRFTRAYLSQDNEKANALIHPDLGLYIIFRPGVADTYEHVKSLDFKKPVPEHFFYGTFENNYVLSFQKLPQFDCSKDKWTKQGFFCDSTETPHQLSQIVDFKKEFEPVTAQESQQIKTIEKDSYRIILTGGDNLIFHIKKYNGTWYVTVLDRAYGWCDA